MTTITEPGLYPDMPDAIYHADPVPAGSLSSTFVRLLTNHVPAKAVELRKRPATAAMTLGKAAHRQALGTGPELIVWQHDGRTKDGKAERAEHADLIASEAVVAVTEKQRVQILGMTQALRAHPEVVEILEHSEAEVSSFWQEGPIWLRARHDLLSDVGAYDYKTCEDCSARGFSKAMANYGYHQQAEFYQRGLKALGHPAGERRMRFICQETSAPYLVQIHEPDDEAALIAETQNDRAMRVYAECTRSGVWPAYPELVAEPTPLPAFYFTDHDPADEMEIA